MAQIFIIQFQKFWNMDCQDCPYKDQANALQKQIEELNSTKMDLIKQRNDQSMHRNYYQKALDASRKEVNDYINEKMEMDKSRIAMKRQIAAQNSEIETLKSQRQAKKTTLDKSVITDSAEDYTSKIANLKTNNSELEKKLKAAQSSEANAIEKLETRENNVLVTVDEVMRLIMERGIIRWTKKKKHLDIVYAN